MDKCSSDAEFDSYWDNEAKNKSRNRIRVGRQYQATIPPLLKPGDKDGRRFEDLETLKWKPDQLSDSDLERYLSMARSITSFSRAIRRCRDLEQTDESSLQAAIKGLTDFVTSHHPCHHDAGCKVPVSISSLPRGECSSSPQSSTSSGGNPHNSSNSPGPNEWSPSEAHLFSQAVEACGKNFCTIKKEYLPWKPVKSLIEYYYNYGKVEKQECSTPASPQPLKVPSPCSVKLEKKEEEEEQEKEPVASCSHQPEDSVVVAECSETKDDPTIQEQVKEEVKDDDASDAEMPAVAVSAEDVVIRVVVETPKDEQQEEGCSEDVKPVPLAAEQPKSAESSETTIGSLKFFLGGRLVLKLNAKQGSNSGTRCQWVQSHDTPKHPYQVKKLKHKKKAVPDSSQPTSAIESPTYKKRVDDDSNATSEDGSPAAKKAKTWSFNTELEFLPLCSASWTPPVADGQESVELDDASSKTSEGCVSPVVFGPRAAKSEVRTETLVDQKPKAVEHVDVPDSRNVYAKAEPLQVPCNSHSDGSGSEQYLLQNPGLLRENVSPKSLPEDCTCTHEVLNHKSALPHSKSATFYTRVSRSGSPSAKLFNKRPSPCDLSEKVRPSSGFQSPVTMITGSVSSEGCPKAESVLDLSSRQDHGRSRDANASYPTYSHISPTRGIENCSSSEGSPHTPSSTDNASSACCKSLSCTSSSCVSCHKTRPQQQQVPIVESKDSRNKTCRKKLNVCHLTDANGAAGYSEKCCSSGQEVAKDDCDRCTCCFDQSSSCTSPKCSKAYLSQDQACNKEGHTSRSPSQNSLCVSGTSEEPCPQKLVPWYGSPASSLFQFYPHTYPYYIAYGISPASVPDSSGEAPLDLSSSSNSKREKTAHGNVPDVQADVPRTAADKEERSYSISFRSCESERKCE